MYRVYICCGRNCGPKGSRELLDFLEEEVARLSLDDRVQLFAGGCQTHCETGPTMVVYPGPVFYQEIDSKRLQRIAREHFAEGRPVAEYFWQDPAKQGFRSRKLQSQPFPQSQADKFPQKENRPPKPKKVYDVDDFKW